MKVHINLQNVKISSCCLFFPSNNVALIRSKKINIEKKGEFRNRSMQVYDQIYF